MAKLSSENIQTPAADAGRRRDRPQHVFEVTAVERLTAHLVRVHLGGPAFASFIAAADPDRLGMTDKYVKLVFARPELGLIPPYDFDELRSRLALEDLPVRRTYTVRSIDADNETIAIDFVVHGDEGIAGPWADSARPGDVLALSGPGGRYAPAQDGGFEYLLIGDESAVPAIAAALEAMPQTAQGRALIEVESPADELPLSSPPGIEVEWVHRDSALPDGRRAEPGTALSDAVRALTPPGGPVSVFAHGERSAMKNIREVLQGRWGLERRALSLSAYWALGRAEDRFQAEKREPVGAIFLD